MKCTWTVAELAERWGVTKQWTRTRIDSGELIARNISPPGSKRATWRIDDADAQAFWDSISTRGMKHRRNVKPLVVESTEASFEDFI